MTARLALAGAFLLAALLVLLGVLAARREEAPVAVLPAPAPSVPVPRKAAVAPAAPTPPPAADPSRVVARVGGVPIHEREAGIDPDAPIAFPPAHVDDASFERLRRESVEPLVRMEVDQVILHREALRRGLDHDPEVRRRAAALREQHEAKRREVLAAQMAQELEREAAEAARVSAEDVDAYLGLDPPERDPSGQAGDPAAVGAVLRRSRAEEAYQRRLLSMVLAAGLAVDGAPVPSWRLEAAARHYLPALAAEEPPGPFEETGFHRLVLDASARRLGEEPATLLADSGRLAGALGATVLSVGGLPLPLRRTGCSRLFEPQPTAEALGLNGIDLHGLSLCVFEVIRREVLVLAAGGAGVVLPDEEQAARRLAVLERQAAIDALLREEGVLDVPQEIPDRARQLTERLRAAAEVELLY